MSDSSVVKSRLVPSLTASASTRPHTSRPKSLSQLPGTFFTSPGFILGIVALEFLYGFVLCTAMSGSRRQQAREPSKDADLITLNLASQGRSNPTAKEQVGALTRKESTPPTPKEEKAAKPKETNSPKPKASEVQAKRGVAKAPDQAMGTQVPPKATTEAPASKLAKPESPIMPAPPPPPNYSMLPLPLPNNRLVAFVEKPQPQVKVEEPKLEPLGPLIDPDHDCKVRIDPQGWTIEVPGKLHIISPEKQNAPRALTEVVGDFDVQVHVPGEIRPGTKPLKEFPFTFQGAGLLVWHDKHNYVRLERTVLYDAGTLHQLMVENCKGGKAGRTMFIKVREDSITLRMERHGGEINCTYSSDGKTWLPVRRWAAGLPPKVSVGISATNISPKRFEAWFTDFSPKDLSKGN